MPDCCFADNLLTHLTVQKTNRMKLFTPLSEAHSEVNFNYFGVMCDANDMFVEILKTLNIIKDKRECVCVVECQRYYKILKEKRV